MRIGADILSLNAQRNLERTSKAFSRALERLASGHRINRAGDDAAGLAISTGLESQVRGLTQAVRNVNDALSSLDVTEGALSTQTELLQRMRELAMQSANGTLSDQDRDYLNSEFQSLFSEFQRNTQQAEFNGVKILDGSRGSIDLQVGTQKGDTIRLSDVSSNADDIFRKLEFTGNFVGKGSYSTTGTFGGMQDVNDDGNPDIVSYWRGGGGQNAIYVKLGLGDGTFASEITAFYSAGNSNWGPNDFEDVDGDGITDIIATGRGANNTQVFKGNGDGTFRSISGVSDANYFVASSFADINKDHKTDVLKISEDAGVAIATIRFANGNGTFGSASTFTLAGTGLRNSNLADLNDDGNVDLTYTYNGGLTMAIQLGNGDGTFQAATTISSTTNTGQPSASQLAHDFNGDGKIDLLLSGNGRLLFYKGNGDGSFVSGVNYGTNSAFPGLTLQDWNDDGEKDVIVSGSTLEIFLSDGSGGFSGQTLSSSAGGSVQDFNNDDHLDYATFKNGAWSISLAESVDVSAVSDLQISTQSQAQNVLSLLDDGIEYINSKRAELGAQRSRLESATNVTSLSIESLSSARSQIMDTDYAEETAEMMKQQILQQAGVSVMAQAQLQMQMVLSLLGDLK